MKIIMLTSVLFSTMAYALTVKGPSFNCKKASLKVEKLICDTTQLSVIDLRLDTSFNKLIVSSTAKQAALIKNDQVTFLKHRNACKDIDCLKKSMEGQLTILDSKISMMKVLNDGISQLKKKYGKKMDDIVLSPDEFRCDSGLCTTYYEGCASTTEGGRCCSDITIKLSHDNGVDTVKDVSALSLAEACKDQ